MLAFKIYKPLTFNTSRYLYRVIVILALFFSISSLYAQQVFRTPTSGLERLKAKEMREQLQSSSFAKNISFRSVGPTIMSGRVVDIEVDPRNPFRFYVAYASGGLWLTENNGLSFKPLFDNEATMTIGDISIIWSSIDKIWLGSGENNSSRSSYAGTGMYYSPDGGKTWQHKGLSESHHIGKILIDPQDENTIYVAALGHLFSPNTQRGIYKTTDNGKSWKRTLYINANVGGIDLRFQPASAGHHMYAAMWQRTRRGWNFSGEGKGSGIYLSLDKGEKWEKISQRSKGFPSGNKLGRIGLATSPTNKDFIYALIDNQEPLPEQEEMSENLQATDFLQMSKSHYLNLPKSKVETYLKDNNFPKKYSYNHVTELIKRGEVKPRALADYLGDANAALFNVNVKGAELYLSQDRGKTWTKTHNEPIENMYFSYGYYFGRIEVDPSDANTVYIMGVPMLKSTDGGSTFEKILKSNVHVDHHALWINPANPLHLINGNDGGINISYDGGVEWTKVNIPAVGQFYTIQVDNAVPYNIYGGLQDNGTWFGPSNYTAGRGWTAEGKYPWQRIFGGDGMQVQVTPDNEVIYFGYQFGNYFYKNKQEDKVHRMRPQHKLGELPLRFNWQTPIHMSKHNPDIIYMASNFLHRSLDMGKTFEKISPDLTRGGINGNVPFGTISTIDESTIKFGLLYTGSDDGRAYVSKNGGGSWSHISAGLPTWLKVSRIRASKHKKGRVYICLNGHTLDDMGSYIYVSENYGRNWRRIMRSLPSEPINVLWEDAKNENLIFVGTDNGLYFSLNRGKTSMAMMKDLPAVAVHDLVIQEREEEIVLGTHGRSAYIAKIGHLRQLVDSVTRKAVHIFPIPALDNQETWGMKSPFYGDTRNTEEEIVLYTKTKMTLAYKILNKSGTQVQIGSIETDKGLNFWKFEPTFSVRLTPQNIKEADNGKFYLPKGEYVFIVQVNGKEFKQKFDIKK